MLRQVRRVAVGGRWPAWRTGLSRCCGPEGEKRARLAPDDERFRLYADNARDLVYRYRFLPTPASST